MIQLSAVPDASLGFVAVAINDDASHLALLFRLENDDQMSMLHLAWDHDLRNEVLPDHVARKYLAASLAIGPIRSKAIAHYCLEVYEANYANGIPYAFGDPLGSFDGHRNFIPGTQRVGLTCASFVLAVLEQAGINIINRDGWGPNYDDSQFFQWVIRALRGEIENVPAAGRPDHADEVQKQVAAGAVRYRPIEIAGAAASGKMLIAFPEAVKQGNTLKSRLPKSGVVPRHIMGNLIEFLGDPLHFLYR